MLKDLKTKILALPNAGPALAQRWHDWQLAASCGLELTKKDFLKKSSPG
jgi:hypothetical protein